MLFFICFLVGFALAYASMLAMYNYLRGGRGQGQDLQLMDHFLIALVSLMNGLVLAVIVFY